MREVRLAQRALGQRGLLVALVLRGLLAVPLVLLVQREMQAQRAPLALAPRVRPVLARLGQLVRRVLPDRLVLWAPRGLLVILVRQAQRVLALPVLPDPQVWPARLARLVRPAQQGRLVILVRLVQWGRQALLVQLVIWAQLGRLGLREILGPLVPLEPLQRLQAQQAQPEQQEQLAQRAQRVL